MNTENLQQAFLDIDKGLSYKDVSEKYEIGEYTLRARHIEFSQEDPDYEKQIQRFTIKLIQDVGVHTIRAMRYKIHKDMADFFESRASNIVPFKYRDTVKSLACKYVVELDKSDREKQVGV